MYSWHTYMKLLKLTTRPIRISRLSLKRDSKASLWSKIKFKIIYHNNIAKYVHTHSYTYIMDTTMIMLTIHTVCTYVNILINYDTGYTTVNLQCSSY